MNNLEMFRNAVTEAFIERFKKDYPEIFREIDITTYTFEDDAKHRKLLPLKSNYNRIVNLVSSNQSIVSWPNYNVDSFKVSERIQETERLIADIKTVSNIFEFFAKNYLI